MKLMYIKTYSNLYFHGNGFLFIGLTIIFVVNGKMVVKRKTSYYFYEIHGFKVVLMFIGGKP